ncbi:MAG: flavin reductase [Rhizobiales bacterium]|nr:flavin reductase [Hyphomicrobiales bacterium]
MTSSAVEFRRILGQFATGVAIVTAQDRRGSRAGATINSFASVSLEPPLVLFSLARSLNSFKTFLESEHFGISILAADQHDLSVRFATSGADKWSGTSLDCGDRCAPLIDRALAKFECELHATVDGGDHLIFVCRVLCCEADINRNPLLFFRGRYLHPGEPLRSS